MTAPPDDEKVGYGRPPKRTRWKKGQSGNPKRKYSPKDDSTVTMIDRLLLAPVEVSSNGVKQKIPALAAIMMQLWTKEIAGDRKAMRTALRYRLFADRNIKRGVEIVFNESEYTRALAAHLQTPGSHND